MSLTELEEELEEIRRAILAAGSPHGVASIESEAAALRRVARLSARRREILVELKQRRAAVAAWQADQDRFDSIVTDDD